MSGVEVYMPVAQLIEHVAEHLKEASPTHAIGHSGPILAIHSIPIEAILIGLIVKEAILGVNDVPQRLEIACGCIFILLHFHTRRQEQQKQ
jgi:hypothetical protein